MSKQIANDKHVIYNDPASMLKLYYYLDSKVSHFNRCYYLIQNKISPLNKIKPNDKISVKYSHGSILFKVDNHGLSQPLVRWFNSQSRKKFFNKFFIIINYYHKKCLEIQEINIIYPKVFSTITTIYDNLGENIICILNTLLITYRNDNNVKTYINTFKNKIRESRSYLHTFNLTNTK